MSNGQGFDVSVPWWVQAIGVIGVTATIALYLVYWVTSTLTSELTVMNLNMSQQLTISSQILSTVQQTQATTTNDVKEAANSMLLFRRQELNLVMQACINAAKSPYQVDQCKERMGGTIYVP